MLQAPHCPSCGAPVDVPPGASRVTCTYCSRRLLVDARRLSTTHEQGEAGAAPTSPSASIDEPDATTWSSETAHFELSVIEQRIDGAPNAEIFRGVELDEGRFAFVSLRTVDRDGRPVAHPLDAAFEALHTSLREDGDPGLAANVALETLAARTFDLKLECGVVLFEPRAMVAHVYNAGLSEGLFWASSEEGRAIAPSGGHDALERKMLRESADHFSNARPIRLAAGDLVIIPSAGYVGRGAPLSYSGGVRALLDVVNAHLGEEPLRIVTLAKNAFWAARREYGTEAAPPGDVRVVAVRAIPPPLASTLPDDVGVHTFRTRKFEIATLTRANDVLASFALRDDRHVLVWLSARGPLPADVMARASAPILALLDGDTGDNENPRRAGREALAALDIEGLQMSVVQLFDEWGRVKYWRHGWKQPVALGPRGFRDVSLQAFDEGGEATVEAGARLFFPGSLAFEGHANNGDALASVWRGGKTSRLYDALSQHWKTKKSEPALRKLALAAMSDVPTSDLGGLALVTGTNV